MLEQMALFKPMGTTPAAPPPYRGPVASPPPISAASATAPAATAPPLTVPEGVVLPPTSGRRKTADAATADPSKKPSFGMGLLGGFVGALVGSIIYYAIFRATGVRIGLALIVGGLAGWGANWLGKGEGSHELAGITVALVVFGVLAAQYFVVLGWWNQLRDISYTASLAVAKEVVKAIPNGTDGEIRRYLAGQLAEEGETIKPGAVSDEEVKAFREHELPRCQQLASGKITKAQYFEMHGHKTDKKSQEREMDTFKGEFMLWTINIRSVISLVIAGGLAYKLCANA